jgi:hypothetical protein
LSDALAILLGHAGILALGLTVASLGFPEVRREGRLGRAFALGAGAVATLLLWASVLAPGSAGAAWVAVPALVGVLARRAAIGRALRASLTGWRRPDVASGLLLAAIALEVALVARGALATGLGTDGYAVWELKAHVAYVAHGIPESYFSDRTLLWSHPEYPWLLPLDEAWFSFVRGAESLVVTKAFFPGVFGALLLLFHSGLGALPRRVRLLFTALLGALPALERWAITGYADTLLALFWLGAVTELALFFRAGSRRSLVLGALLVVLAASTKREGLVGLGLVTAALAAAPLLGRTYREVAPGAVALVLSSALVLGPWLLWLARHGVVGADFGPVSAGLAIENRARIPRLAAALVRELGQLPSFGLLFHAFLPCSLVLLGRRRDRASNALLVLGVALPLAGLTGAFVFSRWPFLLHARLSLERLVLQEAPLALLVVARAFEGRRASG